MKKIIKTIYDRWRAETPKFFHWVMGIAVSGSGVAIAVHTSLVSSGAEIPNWWSTIYPYLIGFGAGMTAVAKLTQKH